MTSDHPKPEFLALCLLLGVTPEEIQSPSRKGAIREARQIICYCLDDLGYGPSEIGRTIKRHHTTVMHSVKVIERDIKYCEKLDETVYLARTNVKKLLGVIPEHVTDLSANPTK